MSHDPLLNHVAQPLVDATGIDARALALRLADVFLLIALTRAVVDVATVTLPGIWLASGIHVFAGFAVRNIIVGSALTGPATLIQRPQGIFHLILRVLMIWVVLRSGRDVAMMIHTGLAGMVPVSQFRFCLELVEALVALVALYLGVCRPAPPRKREDRRVAVRS